LGAEFLLLLGGGRILVVGLSVVQFGLDLVLRKSVRGAVNVNGQRHNGVGRDHRNALNSMQSETCKVRE
jgi:hypothetical protein